MKVGDKVTVIRTAGFGRGEAKSEPDGYGIVRRRYKHINAIVIGLGKKRRFIKLDDATLSVYMWDTMLKPEERV